MSMRVDSPVLMGGTHADAMTAEVGKHVRGKGHRARAFRRGMGGFRHRFRRHRHRPHHHHGGFGIGSWGGLPFWGGFPFLPWYKRRRSIDDLELAEIRGRRAELEAQIDDLRDQLAQGRGAY